MLIAVVSNLLFDAEVSVGQNSVAVLREVEGDLVICLLIQVQVGLNILAGNIFVEFSYLENILREAILFMFRNELGLLGNPFGGLDRLFERLRLE